MMLATDKQRSVQILLRYHSVVFHTVSNVKHHPGLHSLCTRHQSSQYDSDPATSQQPLRLATVKQSYNIMLDERT